MAGKGSGGLECETPATVDGGNLAPPYIPSFAPAVYCEYQLVQDSLHHGVGPSRVLCGSGLPKPFTGTPGETAHVQRRPKP